MSQSTGSQRDEKRVVCGTAWSISQGEVVVDGSKGSWSQREERSFSEKVVSRLSGKPSDSESIGSHMGSEESLYLEQLGQSVKEKSLSMGSENLGVRDKN